MQYRLSFRQGLAALATALLCKQASQYSDDTVAAVTIANKCYMLVRNIVLEIGQMAQPLSDLATFIIATPFHVKMSKYLNKDKVSV